MAFPNVCSALALRLMQHPSITTTSPHISFLSLRFLNPNPIISFRPSVLLPYDKCSDTDLALMSDSACGGQRAVSCPASQTPLLTTETAHYEAIVAAAPAAIDFRPHCEILEIETEVLDARKGEKSREVEER